VLLGKQKLKRVARKRSDVDAREMFVQLPANAIPYGEELALLQSNDVVSVTSDKARRGAEVEKNIKCHLL